MSRRWDKVEDGSSSKASVLSEGRLALGITIGVVLSVITYLMLGLGNHGNVEVTTAVAQTIPTVVALVVALASLLVSYNLLSEQRLVRQAGTDPVILVHLGQREDAPALVTLEIRNVGAGAAVDVQVRFLTDLSHLHPEHILVDLERMRHPIRAIPQGHSLSYAFGVGFKLLAGPLPSFDVEVEYYDIDGGQYRSRQSIDVRELRERRADDPPVAKLSRQVGRISGGIESIARSLKKMHVVTETLEQHHKEE